MKLSFQNGMVFLLVAFVVAAAAQTSGAKTSHAAEWVPSHVGDKWLYEHESRDDTGLGAAHLEIQHWKTLETTVGSWILPEGTVIEKQIQMTEGTAPQEARAKSTSAYLIRGDCLYMGADWNRATHKISPEFVKELSLGYISPDFCFPLAVHKTWGASAKPERAQDWRVAGLKSMDASAPGRQITFHVTTISSYLGSGTTADRWYEKGVGIIREQYIHHGTIGEERRQLLRFEEGIR